MSKPRPPVSPLSMAARLDIIAERRKAFMAGFDAGTSGPYAGLAKIYHGKARDFALSDWEYGLKC